MFIIDLIISV